MGGWKHFEKPAKYFQKGEMIKNVHLVSLGLM